MVDKMLKRVFVEKNHKLKIKNLLQVWSNGMTAAFQAVNASSILVTCFIQKYYNLQER